MSVADHPVDQPPAGRARRRELSSLVPLLPLIPLAVAVGVITAEARRLDPAAVWTSVREIPVDRLLAAFALTVASFVVLTGYDALGALFARVKIAYRRSALAATLGFALSQSLGFTWATGIPVRYRLYATWGLTPSAIREILAFYVATFWIATLNMTGLVLLLEPGRLLPMMHLPAYVGRPLGALLVVATALYVVWASGRDRTLTLWSWEIRAPGPGIAFAQLALGAVDWAVAAAVLYVLLPGGPEALPFPTFLGVFLLAQVAGQISHVPGGLGVFDALILTFLPDDVGTGVALAALLVYRIVYYVVPLVVAILALGGFEAWARRERLGRAGSIAARGVSIIVPPAMAVAVFLTGLVLLVSGAVPASAGRLDALERFVPLAFVEVSHFLASLVGAFLLILAWAIQRRLTVAYHVTLTLLAVGAALSVMKGLDYEEALILIVIAFALAASGREFYRRSSLLAEPWTVGWAAGVVGAGMVVAALGLVAHHEPLGTAQHWWLFQWNAEAPRSFRAIVGAISLIGMFGVLKLLSPAAPRLGRPSEADARDAATIAFASPRTYAQLVLLGDKQILFDRARSAFIMFAIQGKSWIAMGDPVGDDEAGGELAWDFRARAHEHADWAVFYQVTPQRLPLYLDMGLRLTKLGEEARVPLADFDLDGGKRKALRRTLRTVEKTGAIFRVVPKGEVAPILPQLRAVSDDWLERKNTREKSFSLGSFEDGYLCQFAVATLALDGRIVAFANIQEGAGHHEATVDLMRYAEGAPHSSMEYLLTRSMLRAKEKGFEWFSLGMAPLAGLEARPLAPIWSHVGAALYRHGDRFYRFEGLREYKEGFDPIWEPRYLAAPGGAALPRVLANVTSLIGGGLVGVVRR